MGVGGVNNTNTDLSIYKKINQTGTSQTSKPSYMTKDGSLWNAPGVKSMYGSSGSAASGNATRTNGTDNNKGKGTATGTGGTEGGGESAAEQAVQKRDAAAGRAAASDAQGQQGGVRSNTSQSEQSTKEANALSKDAQNLESSIKKENQQFKTDNNKAKSQVNQTNRQISTISQNIRAEQTELDSLTNELDSIVNADKTGSGTHSAFSLNLAGSEQGGVVNSGNDDSDRIADLQQRIESKGNVIKMYNQNVVVLTKKSSSTLRSANRAATTHVKQNQKSQKALKSNQEEVSGFEKFANKASEVATTVTEIGQGVKLAGIALINLGWVPYIGGALEAAGNFMKPIGETTESIGNLGQSAASVLQMSAAIANGDISGALSNAVTAVQCGAAGVEGLKQASADWKEVTKSADEAGKAAEQGIEKANEIKEKANEVQDKLTSEGPVKPTAPEGTKVPDKLTAPGSTSPTTGISEGAAAGAGITSDTQGAGLSGLAQNSPLPDKIEIKEGSGLDKALKNQEKTNMKRAKATLRKEKLTFSNFKQSLGDIQNAAKSFPSGKSSKAPSSSTTTQKTQKQPLEWTLSPKVQKLLAKSAKRTANIQARYAA